MSVSPKLQTNSIFACLPYGAAELVVEKESSFSTNKSAASFSFCSLVRPVVDAFLKEAKKLQRTL